MKGRKAVHTRVGGVFAILIMSVVIFYGSIKFLQLYLKHNPTMSEYFKENEFANGIPINLNESNFRMAINVEDYHKPYELKNDPRYVRWIFRMYGKKENVYF